MSKGKGVSGVKKKIIDILSVFALVLAMAVPAFAAEGPKKM